jgi:hypothetical protein
VLTLAVSGRTVYAGGEFSLVGSMTRDNIAALDTRTGRTTAWNPGANGAVDALAVSGPTRARSPAASGPAEPIWTRFEFGIIGAW